MQKHLHDLQQMSLINDMAELKIRAAQLVQAAGFTNHMYAFAQPAESHSRADKIVPLLTDYPDGWLSRYISRRYFKVDPVVAHCYEARLHPMVWSQARFVKQQPDFAEEAMTFGLIIGLCFPLRDRAGRLACWSLALNAPGNDQEAFLLSELPWTNLLCTYLHDAFQRLNSPAPADHAVELTAREVECLTWCAAGKTAWEVGHILHISEWTVTYHMRNIKRKLGVGSRAQIVVRAIALGLIKP